MGAVITDSRHRIIGCGYNGAPAGMDQCDQVGCQEQDSHCVRAVHADINAILNAPDPALLRGGTMFLFGGTPCNRCAQAIISVGICRLICVSARGLYDRRAWSYLAEAGLKTMTYTRSLENWL